MRYNDETLNPANQQATESIPNLPEGEIADKSGKKIKAHVIRRNVEDYLEQKALERRLKDVFEDEYLLD